MTEFYLLSSSMSFSRFMYTMISIIILGSVFLYYGVQKYNRSKTVKNSATEKIRSMSVGRTELKGKCREHQESIDLPFTDGKCLYVIWKIVEKDSILEDWTTVDSGELKRNFILEDETGRTLVEVEEENVTWISGEETTEKWKNSIISRLIYRIRNKKYPAEEIEKFCRQKNLESEYSLYQERMYIQKYIPIGSEVYVLGRAEPTDRDLDIEENNTQKRKIVKDQNENEFIVSNKNEEGLIKKLKLTGVKYIIMAALIYIVGLSLSTIIYI
jgi:hypothetical protein